MDAAAVDDRTNNNQESREGTYPSQCWTSDDQITVGIVRAKLNQNLSRNIATILSRAFGRTHPRSRWDHTEQGGKTLSHRGVR